MRSIDTEHDIVELLGFVGTNMPEGHISPYSDDCEMHIRIEEDGLRCSNGCPFIGVVVANDGEHVGSNCCPMFRIGMWRKGKRSSTNMTAIVSITQKVGEL